MNCNLIFVGRIIFTFQDTGMQFFGCSIISWMTGCDNFVDEADSSKQDQYQLKHTLKYTYISDVYRTVD